MGWEIFKFLDDVKYYRVCHLIHNTLHGLVASRLVAEFARPVFIIGLDGDHGKGSGRSISNFDL